MQLAIISNPGTARLGQLTGHHWLQHGPGIKRIVFEGEPFT
jgi:hypothetical protein